MTDKIPLSLIEDILASNVSNSSSVSGTTVQDALNTLQGQITGGSGFDFVDTVDPAIDTNPSSNGAIWKNNTTGEIFVCIDNTTDENIWVGTSGNFVDLDNRRGRNFGYVAGGDIISIASGIERFAFSSSVTTSNIGSMALVKEGAGSTNSLTHGYSAGGVFDNSGNERTDRIERFQMTTLSDGTDVGLLTLSRRNCVGSMSMTNGFTQGGSSGNAVALYNNIDTFAFGASVTSTDVGDLTSTKRVHAGCSSKTHGYSMGGLINTSNTSTNVIDRFAFASIGNAVDVGDLTQLRGLQPVGAQDENRGYCIGANGFATIDRFNFTSNTDATEVGNITSGGSRAFSSSSGRDHIYIHGVFGPTTGIERFAIQSTVTTVDVGDLIQAKDTAMGFQQ